MFYLFLAIGILGMVLLSVLLISEKSFNWLCKNPRGSYLCPTVIFIALIVFGATGCVLPRFAELSTLALLLLSIVAAAASTVLVNIILYWSYRRLDSSLIEGDLLGSEGEVTISIPSGGYGEVEAEIDGSVFSVIASSSDSLQSGARVIVESILGPGKVKVAPKDTSA